MAKAIFLDRDGVLNELVYYAANGEYEAPRSLADLRLLPGVTAALKRATSAGWLLFIVTNQPGSAKGKATIESLRAVHESVLSTLEAGGVRITKSFECFHHPHAVVAELRGPCECRKPSPFFLLEAQRLFGVSLPDSWMIGDQDSDLACGRNAGCRVALLEHPMSANKRGALAPDLRCSDLSDFLDRIGVGEGSAR